VSAYLARDNALAESTIHRCPRCDQRITAPRYMRQVHQCTTRKEEDYGESLRERVSDDLE
jgi:uncharacterized protein (DUF983 family)